LAVKITRTIFIVAALLIGHAWLIGLVGFHYRHVIENEPLKDPHRVLRAEGTNLFLEDGTVIALNPFYREPVTDQLKQANFEVDVERDTDGSCCVLARRRGGWICGTQWAQPIKIPLIVDTVYRNRRQMIGLGSYVVSKGQQDGAASGSQPIRSETNRASSAAGSRR
jgi:hypothetical protein